MKEAVLWRLLEKQVVQCGLCAHNCRIAPGRTGLCSVRKNVNGVLYSLNYGKVVALNSDPIEKKPLFHFLPGSRAFSVASVGCNFRCDFCQNHSISQQARDSESITGRAITPSDLVEAAKAQDCPSIAHTYTEPTIYMEFALETARLAGKAGIHTVFVSNGFMSAAAVGLMSGLVSAINIDLKTFSDRTYREIIGGRLEPVLENIRKLHEAGVLVEVTTLVIPGLNDSDSELREIASFLVSVSPRIPWHVSRFHPAYRMLDRPPTPVATVMRARGIGLEEGLEYVYCGNMPGNDGESTFCGECRSLLVKRSGFQILENRLDGNRCPDCGVSHHFFVE